MFHKEETHVWRRKKLLTRVTEAGFSYHIAVYYPVSTADNNRDQLVGQLTIVERIFGHIFGRNNNQGDEGVEFF